VLNEARAIARTRGASGALPLAESLRLLELFGIPASPSAFTADLAATVAASEQLGFPVVLKTAAPDILHKTDASGVVLDLRDRAAVAGAYTQIAAACGKLVQVQAQAPAGTEVLLGMINDAQFGPMMTVGLGGVLTEILADVVTFQPPVSADAACGYLRRLRGYPLLQGYRGRPKADLDALARVIERFSVLCATIGPMFAAIDLNPVIAAPSGALAVDALFLLLPTFSQSGSPA
jgi:hypothetical protein